MTEPVIEIINLKKTYHGARFRSGDINAVDGVSFRISRGEALGLLGESGSGKSTLGRCILRLIEPTSGEIYFGKDNIVSMNGNLRSFRKRMQIIFQDADGALNPRMKVKNLLLEPLKVHRLLNGKNSEKVSATLAAQVNLPADLMNRYPSALSGGQRQRIAISRAISINPEFIVADEAVASLDLIGQAQVMALFNRLKEKHGISFLTISHNLRFIRETTDALAVMYAGELVEIGKTMDVMDHPAHPYTQALLSANQSKHSSLDIKNTLASLCYRNDNSVPGCSYQPRCPGARAVCRHNRPYKRDMGNGHYIWCHL